MTKSADDRARAIEAYERPGRAMWNVTYLNPKTGLRTLMGPAQGRCMYESREAAEKHLQDLLGASEDRLVDIYGEGTRGTFRVDVFDCYDSGDPKGIYVQIP